MNTNASRVSHRAMVIRLLLTTVSVSPARCPALLGRGLLPIQRFRYVAPGNVPASVSELWPGSIPARHEYPRNVPPTEMASS